MTNYTISLLLSTLLVVPQAALGAMPSADEVFERTDVRRGLFVVVDDSSELAIQLAKAEPVVVHVLTPGEATVSQRESAVTASVHGRVTVGELPAGRLPLLDNLAAVVVADLDSQGKLDRAELLRVIRPGGRLLTKVGGHWNVEQKPRPRGVDDWPQYHHDAAMTDRSDDLLAGPAQGVQWLGGKNSIQSAKMGARIMGSLILLADERGVVVRDAFSGLPIWRRADLRVDNRYALLVDEKRVYLVPRPEDQREWAPSMLVLDLYTGKQIAAYHEGIQLGWASEGMTAEAFDALNRTDRAKASEIRDRAAKTYDGIQARLDDGVLLQSLNHQLVALDAASGKRLWSKELTGVSTTEDPRRGEKRQVRHTWHHPMILEGRVYAVEGEPAPSWSYTHWPMGAIRAIHCLDLKTGKSQWTWQWPDSLGAPAAAYNMTPVGDWLGLMLRTRASEKSAPAIVFVHRDGRRDKFSADTPYGKEIGGGHSHARLLFAGGKVWVNGTTNPIAAIDLDQPGERALWDTTYAKLPRPVGCTVTRATPNYVFGSLTTYSLAENAIQHTNAARSVCDVGAIPAAGMTFITPTQCFCAPYLPGFKAFHSGAFAGEEQIDRLEKGNARPAQKTTAPRDWPMYMSSALRNNWTDAKVPPRLAPRWTIKPAGELSDHPIAHEWRDNWYTQGPVTPVSIAEGVAVFALVDRQRVVAVDPATGHERWAATVDGRIDTSPTIRDGLVYVGTRNGWIYALNRDTGELAWRFFTAPRRERMLAFGELESPWPLHGSVLVEDDGVWAIAGRHNDADAGLWWWRLDPTTGEPIASGRLGGDELSTEVGVGRRSDGRQSGANTPIVSNGKLMFLAGIYLEKRDGKLVDYPIPRESGGPGEHQWWADRFAFDMVMPGNQGLVFDYTQMGGYKMPYYGHTQAAVYAYHGKDFLHAGGTTTMQHRGGDRGGRRTTVTRFRKLDQLAEVPHPQQQDRTMTVGADVLWAAPYHESDGTGLGGLAVAGDAVFVGFSVENRDHWRDRDEMPHRLRSLHYQTGEQRQDDLALPAKPVLHGVSVGEGHVYVACEDGSIVCLGAE